MALASEQLELPGELRDLVLNGKCTVFIGSGVSSGSYDSWTDLVNGLCKHCGSSLLVSHDSPSDALLDAAQDAKDTDQERYHSVLGEHFGRPAGHASLLYDALLSLPFECYLTVNLDPLLALKCRTSKRPCDTNIKAYPALDRRAMTKRSIHYLHGYIAEGTTPTQGTVVLARSEFEVAYGANSNLMNFLVPTLENDPLVFVGCRLREPTMPRVFSICKQHQKTRMELMADRTRGRTQPPQRFIFLPKPEVMNYRREIDAEQSRAAAKKEESYYSKMGITPVWYGASGEDHSALRFALEQLAELPDIKADYGWDGGVHVS